MGTVGKEPKGRASKPRLLEANLPESLQGPGLSNETLVLPTIWKILYVCLGTQPEPSAAGVAGFGVPPSVCVCQPSTEFPEVSGQPRSLGIPHMPSRSALLSVPAAPSDWRPHPLLLFLFDILINLLAL